MKRYTLFLLGALSFSAVHSAAVCNTECRRTCIKEGLGDACFGSCGCETLANAVTMQFSEQ